MTGMASALQRSIPVHGNSVRSIMAEAILNAKADLFSQPTAREVTLRELCVPRR